MTGGASTRKKVYKVKTSKIVPEKRKRPPALTVEGRENQLTALAISLAEKQIRDGTVSSQVLTYFLKQGSITGKQELEKLKKENLLLQAKTEALKSAGNAEKLISEAITALKLYGGNSNPTTVREKKKRREITAED